MRPGTEAPSPFGATAEPHRQKFEGLMLEVKPCGSGSTPNPEGHPRALMLLAFKAFLRGNCNMTPEKVLHRRLSVNANLANLRVQGVRT